MKKYLGVLLILLLIALTVCACGNKQVKYQEQYDLGVKYLSEGNYEEAIIAFEAAIKIDARQTNAYKGLAEVYLADEQLEKVVDTLEKALTMDNSDSDLYQQLAEAYYQLGELQTAREVLQKGIEKTGSTTLQDMLADYQSQIAVQFVPSAEAGNFQIRIPKAEMVRYAEVATLMRQKYGYDFSGVRGWDVGFTWMKQGVALILGISALDWDKEPIDYTLEELNAMDDSTLAQTFVVIPQLRAYDSANANDGWIADEANVSLHQDGDYLVVVVNDFYNWSFSERSNMNNFNYNINDCVFAQPFCYGSFSMSL